jgi:hypothetical protein
MWAQLKPWLREQGARLVRWLGVAVQLAARGVVAAWRFLRPYLIFTLNVALAILLLFEEWGWRPLSNLLAQLARFRIWALVELWIAGLPPYGAVVALGIPTAILVPAKLFGVYLLALGHVFSAVLVLIAAKLASTALIARIFLLTKPALMQIGWFQRAYDWFVPWQEALFGRIRSSWVWRYGRVLKWRAGSYLRRTWRTVRPHVEGAWTGFRPRLVALGRQLRLGAREAWVRGSLAGARLRQRLLGPHG